MKLPYQVVLRYTTATEFLRWMEYMSQEERREKTATEKLDFYMAQLTAEVRRSWVSDKDRKQVKAEDFVLHFESDAKKAEKKLTKEERTKRAKAFWLPLVGIGKHTNKKVAPLDKKVRK